MPSVNKSKLLEAAQKQIAKGNLDKALKEYQKILKADANDTGVRLKAGELCERIGDRSQALAEYRRVASTFTSQGFYSKAVAVLKRIQNADPNQVEIHLELAELNEKLGLLSEVVHHYQLAANAYDRRGEKRAAIDILKKVSEVGQSNLERKVKVAELYYKEGFPEAGFEQFMQATADLEENSPELVEVAIRMCKASPEDSRLIERLGAIYLGQGEAKLAIEALERARAISAEPSTLELLANAKIQVDLPGEARTLLEKAAALYEGLNEKAKAREVSARATELAEQSLDGAAEFLGESPAAEPPADAEAGDGGRIEEEEAAASEASPEPAPEPLETPEPVETAEPEDAEPPGEETPEPPAEIAETSGGIEVSVQEEPPAHAEEEAEDDDLSEDERLEVAFSEAEVYRKYGKLEGAARVLEAVARRFPHRHEPRIRLKDLYTAAGNWAKVADQCRMLGLIASARGDDLRSSRFLDEAKEALARLADGPEVAEAEADEPPSEAADVPEAGAETQGSSPPVNSAPAFGSREEDSSASLDFRIDDESLGGEEPGPEEPQQLPAAADPLAAIEEQLIRPDAFPGGESPGPGETGEGAGAGDEAPAADDSLLDLELVIDDEGANPTGTPLAEELGSEPEPPSDPLLEEPAESVDLKGAELLASQGRFEEAASIYARAVEAFPEDRTIRARHESLVARGEAGEEQDGPAAPQADSAEPAGIEAEGTEDLEVEDGVDGAVEGRGVDEVVHDDAADAVVLLDEIAEEDPSWDWVSSDGRLSSSNELGAPPSETRAEAAEEEGEVEAEPAEQSAFDLRAVLEQDPDAPDDIGDVSDATEALSDLVSELQKEEQEIAASLDSQTHYDLGVAYKEMGLLEEAVRELSLAVKDPARRVECCEVLGVCYREQGRPEEAVRMLEECLGDGSIATESAPGLLYEMAAAQEAMGNLGKALDWYERVHHIDPHFSDVSARMASLRDGEEGVEPEPAPPNPLDGEGLDEIEEMLDDLESDS